MPRKSAKATGLFESGWTERASLRSTGPRSARPPGSARRRSALTTLCGFMRRVPLVVAPDLRGLRQAEASTMSPFSVASLGQARPLPFSMGSPPRFSVARPCACSSTRHAISAAPQICAAPTSRATQARQHKPNACITFLHSFHDFFRPAPRRALSYPPAGVCVHYAPRGQLVAVQRVKTPTAFSGVRRSVALNGIQVRCELSPGPNNNQGLVRPVARG